MEQIKTAAEIASEFTAIYLSVLPELAVVRAHPNWQQNKELTEEAIDKYRKSLPIKTNRVLAIMELVSKTESENVMVSLIACITEQDLEELKNYNYKAEKNE